MNDILRVNFYNTVASAITTPFDCNSQSGNGEHGESLKQDCQFLRYEVCAMKTVCPTADLGTCAAADQLKYANFLACAEKSCDGNAKKCSFADPPACAQKLFTAAQITAIEACAGSTAGGTGPGTEAITLLSGIQSQWTAKKSTLKYAFFPTVLINSTRCISCGGSNPASFIQVVCNAYKGARKPAACSSLYQLAPSWPVDNWSSISLD